MKSFKILFFLSLILSVSSCKKGYLDKGPDGDLTMEQIFTNPEYAEGFLSNIYTQLPEELKMVDNSNGGLPSNIYTSASDELKMSWDGSRAWDFNAGTWSAVSTSTDQDIWTNSYSAIRKANLFLENIDKLAPGPKYGADIISRWKGEAMFLRAFHHFLLIRVYGPVPIMDKTVGLSDDYLAFRRQPIDQCVAFIANECDKAAALLDTRVTATLDIGRPSKVAALALKARVLLYMASPLWNGNSDYASLKQDGVNLFPSADASRWQTAATAAKACIDLAESAGHKIYKSVDPTNYLKNYQEVFYKNWNDEVIFAKNVTQDYNINYYSEPRGFTGAGGPHITPTQNMVDTYEMQATGEIPITGYNADNTPIINAASGYVEDGQTATATNYYVAGTRNMYVGRDPRFYASIRFTGMKDKWERVVQPRNTPLQFWKGGLDGRTNTPADAYSRTGYLLKKLTNPDFVASPKTEIKHIWIFFRLGEQYLNYAEALNEAQGPVADVYKYVNLIRQRSGMPSLPVGLSKDDMRTRIRHERQIELAFETHRYFDTLRWKIAATTANPPILVLDVNGTGYNMSSDAFYKRLVYEKRPFLPKHYLWPIPQKEMDKNIYLVQNPGW